MTDHAHANSRIEPDAPQDAIVPRFAFSTTRKLRFGDCDPSGIAYFPSYLDLMVGAVEDFFASLGAPWSELIDIRRIGTPTLRLDLTFLKPSRHGDVLDFTIHLARIGNSSLDLEHQVFSSGQLLWKASQRLVATSLDTNKACAWPDDIRHALTSHLEKQNA
jgi:4-hydroxybenzoyl-CoA thioesterase